MNYAAQIQEVCLAPDSDSAWSLPPPALAAFSDTLLRAGSTVTATWTFRRNLPLDNQMLYAAGRPVALTEATAAEFIEAGRGAGYRALNFGFPGSGFRVQGSGFRFKGLCRVSGLRCKV